MNQVRLMYLLRPREVSNRPNLQILSVYRDYGVIPKDSRSDNFNKTPQDISRYQEVLVGDLVVNKMKAWQGSLGVSPHHGIVSPDYLVCSVGKQVHSRFMHYLLRSAPLVAEFGARSQGIRPAQWRLYWEDLANISVKLPPLTEQRRIADFLDVETERIDRAVDRRSGQLALVEERYKSFISEVVTPGISSIDDMSEIWPWLPKSVRTVRLGYLARVQSGVTVHNAREKSHEDDLFPYLRVANVQGELLDLSDVKEIVIPVAMARRSMLVPGDVVMTEANGNPDNLGRGAVWRGEIPNMVHQNHVFAIRANREHLMPEYLSVLLASSHGRRYFRFTSTQVGIATTSSLKVLDFPVPKIPVARQQAAVELCERERLAADRVTGALGRQLALLTERRQALITAAVTGQIDVTTARGVSEMDGVKV